MIIEILFHLLESRDEKDSEEPKLEDTNKMIKEETQEQEKDKSFEKAVMDDSIKENGTDVEKNRRQSLIPRHKILIKQKSKNEQALLTSSRESNIDPALIENGYQTQEDSSLKNCKPNNTINEEILKDVKISENSSINSNETKNESKNDKLFKGAIVTAMVSNSLSSSSNKEAKTRKISSCKRKDSKAGFPTSKIPAPKF